MHPSPFIVESFSAEKVQKRSALKIYAEFASERRAGVQTVQANSVISKNRFTSSAIV